MLPAPRRAASALVLVCLALTGCYRMVPTEAPEAGEPVDALLLRSGDLIDIPSSRRAVLEDSAVVVRDAEGHGVIDRYSLADIDQFMVRELERTKTAGVVFVVGLAALVALLFASMDDMYGPILSGGSTY